MSEFKNICIIGGDMRLVYMAEYLAENNMNIYAFNIAKTIVNNNIQIASSLDYAINNSRIIILPTPVSNNMQDIFSINDSGSISIANLCKKITKKHYIFGGCLPEYLIDNCQKNKISYYDFMTDNSITILNAIATAEGSIMKAISNSPYNIHGNNALVIGYGKCGSVLADKLKGLGAKCYICARKYSSLCEANSRGLESFHINELKYQIANFKFVFNTVPACILTSEILNSISKDTVIIDIASFPGGVDFEYATSLGINSLLFTGIPGKVSPKSSAEILVNKVIDFYNSKNTSL